MKDQLYKAFCFLQPYKLQLKVEPSGNIETLCSLSNLHQLGTCQTIESSHMARNYVLDHVKPILRHLSTLDQEQEINGEVFNPIDELNKLYQGKGLLDNILDAREIEAEFETEDYNTTEYIKLSDTWAIREKLLEWHFDIFSLIDQGLAVDYRTLKE